MERRTTWESRVFSRLFVLAAHGVGGAVTSGGRSKKSTGSTVGFKRCIDHVQSAKGDLGGPYLLAEDPKHRDPEVSPKWVDSDEDVAHDFFLALPEGGFVSLVYNANDMVESLATPDDFERLRKGAERARRRRRIKRGRANDSTWFGNWFGGLFRRSRL